MTLKQIAKKYGIDYGTIYCAAMQSGLLVRGTKYHEYDEDEIIRATREYIEGKIRKHMKALDELRTELNRTLEL